MSYATSLSRAIKFFEHLQQFNDDAEETGLSYKEYNEGLSGILRIINDAERAKIKKTSCQ